MNYPLISEYEREIKTKGSTILNLPQRYEFVPIKTTPITIYKYGSGAFAGVFKVANLGKHYALRVFLNGGTNEENINRTIEISQSLSKLSADFLCEYQFYQQGITIKGNSFPAIIMEWIDGKPLNNYVDSILNQNTKISELQAHLVKLSEALEKVKMAHGDIQSGNVLVVEKAGNIQLKLVDYDAMFIPELSGKRAVETGHSSFQHPKRDKSVYNAKMDRFSFWLILTALEAIKFDKKLWSKDISVGFNDGDNFLFRASDLQNPNTSPLIEKLRKINQHSLNFYLDKLLSDNSKPSRDKVVLFEGKSKITTIYTIEKKTEKTPIISYPPKPKIEEEEPKITIAELMVVIAPTVFRIDSAPSNAIVFCNNTMLGNTPIELDITQYANKKIEIAYGNKGKAFFLNPAQKEYKVKLEERVSIYPKPLIVPKPPIPEPPKPQEDESFSTAIVVMIILLCLAFIFIMLSLPSKYSSYTYNTTEDYFIVDSAIVEEAILEEAMAVEESAVEIAKEKKEDEVVSFVFNSESENLHIKLGNVYADEGCGSTFATSSSEYNRNNYILIEFFTSYFWGSDTSDFYITMRLNGNIENLYCISANKERDTYSFKNNRYKVNISLNKIETYDEFFVYQGDLEISYLGDAHSIIYPLYGGSGC